MIKTFTLAVPLREVLNETADERMSVKRVIVKYAIQECKPQILDDWFRFLASEVTIQAGTVTVALAIDLIEAVCECGVVYEYPADGWLVGDFISQFHLRPGDRIPLGACINCGKPVYPKEK